MPERRPRRPVGRTAPRQPAPPARRNAPLSTRDALRQRGPTRRQLSRHERSVRQRRYMLFGGAILLAAIVLIVGFGWLREYVLRGQEIVATIYGEPVSANELVEATKPELVLLDRRIALYRANGLTQQASQFQFQRDSLAETTLKELIQSRVVRRAAAARGITVTSDEIDAKMRQIVADSDNLTQPQPSPTLAPTAATNASPTPAGTPTPRPTPTVIPTLTGDRFGPALQAYLNTTSLTESQLRLSLENELYDQKLRDAISQEVPAFQEQVHARHIVFANIDASAAGLQQLQSGTPWETLAASSTDATTKDQAGDLGWLPRLGRDVAFDDAAFALLAGQTSELVQTSRGVAIIQVLERDPSRPLSDSHLDELRRRRYQDWLSTATSDPEITRQLSPDQSAWVLERAAGGRRAPA